MSMKRKNPPGKKPPRQLTLADDECAIVIARSGMCRTILSELSVDSPLLTTEKVVIGLEHLLSIDKEFVKMLVQLCDSLIELSLVFRMTETGKAAVSPPRQVSGMEKDSAGRKAKGNPTPRRKGRRKKDEEECMDIVTQAQDIVKEVFGNGMD